MSRQAQAKVADRRRARPPRPTPDRRGSIPQRLNYLFDTVRTPNGKPYSAARVKRWIQDNGGQISDVYILKILNGERSKPSPEYLAHFARFFGVEPTFFTEPDPPELDAAAQAATVLRNDPMRSMLTRASSLSPRSQQALNTIIDSLLTAERRNHTGANDPRGDPVQSMLVRAARLTARSQQALSDIIDSLLQTEDKDV